MPYRDMTLGRRAYRAEAQFVVRSYALAMRCPVLTVRAVRSGSLGWKHPLDARAERLAGHHAHCLDQRSWRLPSGLLGGRGGAVGVSWEEEPVAGLRARGIR